MASRTVLFSDKTTAGFLLPFSMDPNIRKSLASVHVSKKCLAALQREFWNILDYPNHVWLPCNVDTSKTGNFLSFLQLPNLDTVLFPGAVQRRFLGYGPFCKRAPLKGTGTLIYNRQYRRFGSIFLSGLLGTLLCVGETGH